MPDFTPQPPQQRGPVAPQAPHSPSSTPEGPATPERAVDGRTAVRVIRIQQGGPTPPRCFCGASTFLGRPIHNAGCLWRLDPEPLRKIAADALDRYAQTQPDTPTDSQDSRQDTPDTDRTTPDNALREQYATAIRALNDGGTLADLDEDNDVYRLVDAVLAVRDRRMEQLTAGRQTWRTKALEMERHRDRIAADFRRWVGRLSQKVMDERKRAERAEAAITRVRAVAEGDMELRDYVEREALRDALDGAPTEPHPAEAERDQAYRERAHLLAWLAALHPANAVITPAPDVDEPGWSLLYLLISGWQMSWHIAPRDAQLFAHVAHVEPTDPRAQWDGHSTQAKYQRIQEHTARLSQAATTKER